LKCMETLSHNLKHVKEQDRLPDLSGG